jgi:hypothetical protein
MIDKKWFATVLFATASFWIVSKWMLKRKSFPGKIGRHAPRAPIHLYIWSEAAIKIMVESAGWTWISELS